MKTMKFLLLMFAIVFIVKAGSAFKPEMNVVSLEGKKTYVAVSNNEPSRFEISILNEQNEVVYYKWVNKKTQDYRKIFDLSRLDEGNYKIKLKAKHVVIKKEVELSDENGLVLVKNTFGNERF